MIPHIAPYAISLWRMLAGWSHRRYQVPPLIRP